jgi:hypothetical protein
MDDLTANNRPDERKPYTRPQIQEVPLRPDEAVLGGCKTASTSGPAQSRCTMPLNCSAPTS